MLEHRTAVPEHPARVVVIGAGGFVGRAAVRRLAADDIPCVPLTRREVDLLSEHGAGTLRRVLQPSDTVVITSAIVPAKTPTLVKQNVSMAEAICEALAASPVSHVVYISSDAVYSDDASPVNESSPREPSTLHGIMHAARELMLKSTVRSSLAILRPSLLFGPGDPHGGYGPNRFCRLAVEGKPITLFGGGEETRDHVYIDDVGEIIRLTVTHRSHGVLNIASGVSTSFRAIAELVSSRSVASVPIVTTPRENPITHRYFDVASRLKAFPTFRCTSLADGIGRVLNGA
jgi:nucleoside-diphosphate-sugar epimerase